MTQRNRRMAALGMLAASCAAILATMPGEPTASASVEGDVAVTPNNPTEVVVRFVVSPDGGTEIDRGSIGFVSGFDSFSASPVQVSVTAVADGVTAGPSDTYGLALPVRVCRDGCGVEMRAVITWDGPPADALRARLIAELSVVYENSVPQGEPVIATITEGHGPPIGRHFWAVVGAFVALLSGAAWIAIGNRLARVRLGLAALGALPPAWVLVQVAAVGFVDAFRMVAFETLLAAAVATLLGLGLAVGVVRTARGDAVALPAAG